MLAPATASPDPSLPVIVQCPARFQRGATDVERDMRGFALKVCTKEGNWDLVGNNTPVFFFRAVPASGAGLVHALGMDLDKEMARLGVSASGNGAAAKTQGNGSPTAAEHGHKTTLVRNTRR